MWVRSLLSMASLAITLLCISSGRAVGHGHLDQRQQQSVNLDRRMIEPSKQQQPRSNGNFRFLNDITKPYFVESLPDVPFDLGELYSGLVPIDKGNKSKSLFFVFQPTVGQPVDEITIEVNGGPGASSLEGFFQETGRFIWQPGTYAPVVNMYSWVNLTNMIWVDQPVGTGFSTGTPTATTQEETAEDFIKFFKNFQQMFGIKRFKIYIAGQSYAGRYVPYISAAMLDQKDTEYYDLRGALAYNPVIGQFDYVQQQVPAVPFMQRNANIFNLNASFMEDLESLHESCGYEDFIEDYLTFPPSEVQPRRLFNSTGDAHCNVFGMIQTAAQRLNPCFSIYDVTQKCPLLWDVLGYSTDLKYQPKGATIYFDRDDVKKAMHAPNQTWSLGSLVPVYVGGTSGPEEFGDLSANPIEHVLPQVIEATNRVLISHGDYDMALITNGTLLAIQNMTWHGQLGFHSAPSTPIELDLPDFQNAEVYERNGLSSWKNGQGIVGIQHYERGLMWAETFQAGHMQTFYQPRVAYRHLQWLLGRIESL